ncbi:hypothetical protein ACLOJK_014704 [Asimina triloba]
MGHEKFERPQVLEQTMEQAEDPWNPSPTSPNRKIQSGQKDSSPHLLQIRELHRHQATVTPSKQWEAASDRVHHHALPHHRPPSVLATAQGIPSVQPLSNASSRSPATNTPPRPTASSTSPQSTTQSKPIEQRDLDPDLGKTKQRWPPNSSWVKTQLTAAPPNRDLNQSQMESPTALAGQHHSSSHPIDPAFYKRSSKVGQHPLWPAHRNVRPPAASRAIPMDGTTTISQDLNRALLMASSGSKSIPSCTDWRGVAHSTIKQQPNETPTSRPTIDNASI